MEVIGFIARIAAAYDTSKLGSYIIQQMFILLPPVLFAASIYMVLARIIRATEGDKFSMIRPSRLTKTFVWGDVFAFYIQGGGGGLTAMGSKQTTSKINFALMGQWIIIGGLALQMLIFGFFCLTAFTFQKRYQKYLDTASSVPVWPEWKEMMHMLYGVSGLIMIRTIFRVVEFAAGTTNYLISHEWPIYIFDVVLMFGVLVLFFVYHPSRIQGLVAGDSNHMKVMSGEAVNPNTAGWKFGNEVQMVDQSVQRKH